MLSLQANGEGPCLRCIKSPSTRSGNLMVLLACVFVSMSSMAMAKECSPGTSCQPLYVEKQIVETAKVPGPASEQPKAESSVPAAKDESSQKMPAPSAFSKPEPTPAITSSVPASKEDRDSAAKVPASGVAVPAASSVATSQAQRAVEPGKPFVSPLVAPVRVTPDVHKQSADQPVLDSPTADSDHFQQYSLKSGLTLREVFDRWSKSAGYTLIWSAPIDLSVEADFTFPAGTTFSQAVQQTLKAFWTRKHSVIGRLYTNRVLVISGRDA